MIYEKESDRDNERFIAEFLSKRYGMNLEQQDKLADLDYVATMKDGEIINIEMRCRNHPWGEYSSVYIKAGKMAVGLRALSFGTRFVFIVMTSDKLIHKFEFLPSNIYRLKNNWSGRVDRGDPADMEWVVEIPIQLFKKLT